MTTGCIVRGTVMSTSLPGSNPENLQIGHAHDREGMALKFDGLPDRASVRAECALPIAIAQDGLRSACASRPIVFGRQRSSDRSPHAEQRKVVAGDKLRCHSPTADSSQRIVRPKTPWTERSKPGKRAAFLRSDGRKAGVVEGKDLARTGPLRHQHQIFRRIHGDVAEEYRIEQGKHCSVHPYANRQRQDRGYCKR